MSKALYLPLSIGYEEEAQEGYTTASQVLGSRNAMEFMNSSLSTIQTFFARMIQLDPEENELFGETGREAMSPCRAMNQKCFLSQTEYLMRKYDRYGSR